jgi:hypothetical protein
MDIRGLKRDAGAAKRNILVRGDEMVAKVPCKIVIPARYIERGLGTLEPEVYVISIYAMIFEDNTYTIAQAPSLMRLTPTDVQDIVIEEEPYVEFSFAKGAVICPNLNLVMRNEMIYYVYNEFTAKGNMPWFMGENDKTIPYENAPRFCGVNVGANPSIMQMVHSSTTRVANNKAVQLRHAVRTPKELAAVEAVTIALRSIIWGPTNTPARIIGSYFKEGLTTALVNPSEIKEPIEDMLMR